MDDLIAKLQQVCAEVWRNYKKHYETFDINNTATFMDFWKDELSALDESYKNDPVLWKLHFGLSAGLTDATQLYIDNVRKEMQQQNDR